MNATWDEGGGTSPLVDVVYSDITGLTLNDQWVSCKEVVGESLRQTLNPDINKNKACYICGSPEFCGLRHWHFESSSPVPGMVLNNLY